jgi:hypothetical protein
LGASRGGRSSTLCAASGSPLRSLWGASAIGRCRALRRRDASILKGELNLRSTGTGITIRPEDVGAAGDDDVHEADPACIAGVHAFLPYFELRCYQ